MKRERTRIRRIGVFFFALLLLAVWILSLVNLYPWVLFVYRNRFTVPCGEVTFFLLHFIPFIVLTPVALIVSISYLLCSIGVVLRYFETRKLKKVGNKDSR